MRESSCIDSPLRGLAMPKAFFCALRDRFSEAGETGASRHEAAERFEVSVSSAIKWVERWRDTRSAAPKPRGGSTSPLEEFASEILALIEEQQDLTLVEIVAELRNQRVRTTSRSLWRFLPARKINDT